MPVPNLPQGYDAIVSTSPYTMLVYRNIHDVLIDRENDVYINKLAESWSTPTPTMLSVKLRDNLYFSDGTQITANDVKKTYEWILDKPSTPFYDIVPIDSIITHGNYLNIYSSREISLQGGFISLTGILKAEDIEKGEDYLNQNPIASGVYYVHFKNDEKVILKKNIYHRDFQSNKKAPDIVELILVPKLENRYEMLLNDEVDFLENLYIGKYDEVLATKKYQILEKDSNLVMYLMLNATSERIPSIRANSALSEGGEIDNPLRDKRVRQAIAHIIDVRSFITNDMHSKAYPIILPALRHLYGYPTEKECYEYDLELSKSLMEKAGYSEGFEIDLHCTNSRISRPLAFFIKQCLEDINIIVNIEYIENNAIRTRDTSRAMILSSMNIRSNFTLGYTLNNRYRYRHNPNYPRGENIFGNYNPRINELLDQITTTSIDISELSGLYKELTDIIIDETFIVPIINPFNIYAVSKKFTYTHRPYLKFTDFSVVK